MIRPPFLPPSLPLSPLTHSLTHSLAHSLAQPGSYDLSSGCPTCDCNFGGAISQICDQESTNGQCPCKPNIIGTLCSIPSPYHYFMALDSFIYEAEQTPMPPVSEIPLLGHLKQIPIFLLGYMA